MESTGLSVHHHSESLEDARRRVARAVSGDDGFDDFRKVAGRVNRAGGTRAKDRAGDPGCRWFFPVNLEHPGEFFGAGAVDQIRRGHRRSAVHAHVKRTVRLEGKAANWIVELTGGDPEVQQNAIYLGNLELLQCNAKVREACMDEPDSLTKPGKALFRKSESLDVAIKCNDDCSRFEERLGVASSAGRSIDDDLSASWLQRLDCFL